MNDQLQAYAASIAAKVPELIKANNEKFDLDPSTPFAEMLSNDSAAALMFMMMVDFITAQPTAEVDNVQIIGPNKVRLSIPLSLLFNGYSERRLALLQQGITSMDGQVVHHEQPLGDENGQ